MAKLETDVESLLKFAKVGEFKYRPFAKPNEAAEEEARPAQAEPEQIQRAPAPKPVDAATLDRAKPVEAAPQAAKTSLSAKFAVLASQPTKAVNKLILTPHVFGKRALPMMQSAMVLDSKDKPLMAVFLRLDSENVGGKKRLYLTK